VDYVGVFRNLQRALAIYGSGSGEGLNPEKNRSKRRRNGAMLKTAIAQTVEFLRKWVSKWNPSLRQRV